MNDEYGGDLVQAYICIVNRLVSCSQDTESHASSSHFHSLKVPSISVESYVLRIKKYFQCSYECFVCSLAYIDLMIQNPHFVLNAYSIHRTILTTLVEAAKFYDDSFFNNELYARIGGVPVDEMNSLELEFVFLINFSLLITPEVYQKFYNELLVHCKTICSSCHHLHLPYLDLVQPCAKPSYLCYSNKRCSDDARATC